jgi:hypothetical protein
VASTALQPGILREMMRGHVWRVRMRNGAEFETWTMARLGRPEAKLAILALANGDYAQDDEAPYAKGDIEVMWEARS